MTLFDASQALATQYVGQTHLDRIIVACVWIGIVVMAVAIMVGTFVTTRTPPRTP